MRTLLLKIEIKNNLIYITDDGYYEDGRVRDFGYQIIFNNCYMTAGWMIVLFDMIKKNAKNK